MKTKTQNKPLLSLVVIFGLCLIGVVLLWESARSAQGTAESISTQNLPQLVLMVGDPAETTVRNLPPVEYLQNAPQTANITVYYEGSWSASAQAAFEYAVSIWETQITSPVEIKVHAKWSNLGAGVLGSAGAAAVDINFPNAPVANTHYPIALANKLAGTDRYTANEDCDDTAPVVVAGPDICASFNSAFSAWYFGTDGNPPTNQWDFASVVLHELGHGLGFFGSMTYGTTSCGGSNLGCWGYGFYTNPFIYDRFTENNDGVALLSFPNFSSQLGSQLISDNVFFDGPNANVANGNTRVELFAPTTWQQGSSYSHLAELFNGTANALMTFSIGPGEVQHNPGPVARGMFQDMGWTASSSPTATPTRTLTPTLNPTCIPNPTATPGPTVTAGTPSITGTPDYLPLIYNVLSNCAPTPTPSRTPTPTATSASNWVTILNETFEGDFPGATWQLTNLGTTPGYQWGKRNCQVFQGSYSGWGVGGGVTGSTLGCNANYPNSVQTWMLYGPFSLANSVQAMVDYKVWLNIEPAGTYLYDGFCVIASPVGGTNGNDYDGWCFYGNSAGWVSDYLNLADIYDDGTVNFTGDSSVWLALVFFSDTTVTYPGGAFVDNLVIRRCAANCNTSLPSRVSTDASYGLTPWKNVQLDVDLPK